MRIKILLLFLLVSCTKDLILEEKTKIIKNEDYFSALAEGYKELSRLERIEFDWVDTEYFAQKGIDAYNKKVLIPASPYSREIADQLTLRELLNAYTSLIELLISADLDVKYNYPLRAARLQILYDYWLEQAEEDWQKEQINRFRDEFWASFESLVATAKLAKIKEQETILAKKYFTIYFSEPNNILDKYALEEMNDFNFRIMHSLNDYRIIIENHTYLKNNTENQKLLSERFTKIKKMMLSAGILRSKILKEQNIFIIKSKEKQKSDNYQDRLEIYILDKKP